MNRSVQLCHLTACIDGDYRYTTAMEVRLVEGGVVEVQVVDRSPAGGMDSADRRSLEIGVYSASCGANPTAAQVTAMIRRALASSSTIRRYGKPSKQLTWGCEDVKPGLSVLRVAAALAWAKEVF